MGCRILEELKSSLESIKGLKHGKRRALENLKPYFSDIDFKILSTIPFNSKTTIALRDEYLFIHHGKRLLLVGCNQPKKDLFVNIIHPSTPDIWLYHYSSVEKGLGFEYHIHDLNVEDGVYIINSIHFGRGIRVQGDLVFWVFPASTKWLYSNIKNRIEEAIIREASRRIRAIIVNMLNEFLTSKGISVESITGSYPNIHVEMLLPSLTKSQRETVIKGLMNLTSEFRGEVSKMYRYVGLDVDVKMYKRPHQNIYTVKLDFYIFVNEGKLWEELKDEYEEELRGIVEEIVNSRAEQVINFGGHKIFATTIPQRVEISTKLLDSDANINVELFDEDTFIPIPKTVISIVHPEHGEVKLKVDGQCICEVRSTISYTDETLIRNKYVLLSYGKVQEKSNDGDGLK